MLRLGGRVRGRVDRARAAWAAARSRLVAAQAGVAAYELELLAAGSAHAEAAWIAERSTAALALLSAESDRLEGQRRATAATTDETRAAARTALRADSRRRTRGGRMPVTSEPGSSSASATSTTSTSTRSRPASAAAEPARAMPSPCPTIAPNLETRIEELRRKLASMTSVNMEALPGGRGVGGEAGQAGGAARRRQRMRRSRSSS